MAAIEHWIDNRPTSSTSGRSGPVYDPATGERTAEVAFASVEEVDAAVASSRSAFADWAATRVVRRQRVMFAFRDLLVRRSDEIAAG